MISLYLRASYFGSKSHIFNLILNVNSYDFGIL